MKSFSHISVPYNFDELLPELKKKSLKWETVCYSETKINNNAKISFYQEPCDAPYGNIILNPGLATNTDIDPLMKTISFWALTHRYNVITINTFLGDFYDKPSFKIAKKNTYDEYVTVLEHSIKFIEQYFFNQKNIIVAHSAGAAGMIDTLNNIVKKDEKIMIDSVLLFAPWICETWHQEFKETIYKHCKSNNYENPHNILPIINIFDIMDTGKTRYVSILPEFFNQIHMSPFKPELMNKWNIFTTFVCGEKDKKAPFYETEIRFQELQKQPNKNLFKFIVLPNAKHSLLNLHKNVPAVISLIKSQRRK